jgi:GTP cyclohydrolase I
MANDKELGERVHKHLLALGLETPMVKMSPDNLEANGGKFGNIQHSHGVIMQCLGLDMSDDSLKDTPRRIAKMYCQEIFNGLDYENFPKCTTVENKMKYEEMVCIDNIEVKSMCEHHFLPFVGNATVAYIPNEKVLGLSKFNRVVDFFARRPQIQERLTEQISAALRLILETEDVAVVIRSSHFCVKLRGVEDSCSDTITSRVAGRFRTVDSLRAEFLALSRSGK